MASGKRAKAMSEDHKPNNRMERDRIERAGGFVQWNRVNGDLAVSRGLGDFSFKNRADLSAKDQKVSCYPDITIHERDNRRDTVLLLACDGLWDVMSNEEAVKHLEEIFASGESSMEKMAEEMLDIALDKGSKDNISVVVARLPGCVIGPAGLGGVDRRRAMRDTKRLDSLL
jgi:serine/threonine protein phosphatase PrpC